MSHTQPLPSALSWCESSEVTLLSSAHFLYVMPQREIRALCHIRWPDSGLCVTCNEYCLTRHPLAKLCGLETESVKKRGEEAQLKEKEGQVFSSCLAQAL